jgi:acetyl-CoA C-acetyltransferase
MTDVFIVEAARSSLGRRNGGLSSVHATDLLGAVQRAAVERSGIDPAAVGQVIGGCVSHVGEQSFNVARNPWLAAGHPQELA